MNAHQPVWRPLDLPPNQIRARFAAMPEPSLLEGDPGFGDLGRWSIYAARPRAVFQALDHAWSLRDAVRGQAQGPRDAMSALRKFLEGWGLDRRDPDPDLDPDAPPFRGGAIGYLGYDLAPWFERLPRQSRRVVRLPDLRLAVYDTAATIDQRDGSAKLWTYPLGDEDPAALNRRLDAWQARLERPASPPNHSKLSAPKPDLDRDAYLDRVARALEYIRAGDIFQVNLAQRFVARGRPEPRDLFERLRAIGPAPLAALLAWDDQAIVAASPESFLRIQGHQIETRPIKGTRPRASDPESDRRLADELAASPKDRAELNMIVDLERNDLGRICRPGTIRVVEAGAIESYAQVHHRVATIRGELRPDARTLEVWRATFPGGSITGAPKIRAMQIIDELEPVRRGPYTGAVGFLSRDGTSRFNIAIRTLVVDGPLASYHVGGGIVADSDPAAEYDETLYKGAGLHRLLVESG